MPRKRPVRSMKRLVSIDTAFRAKQCKSSKYQKGVNKSHGNCEWRYTREEMTTASCFMTPGTCLVQWGPPEKEISKTPNHPLANVMPYSMVKPPWPCAVSDVVPPCVGARTATSAGVRFRGLVSGRRSRFRGPWVPMLGGSSSVVNILPLFFLFAV